MRPLLQPEAHRNAIAAIGRAMGPAVLADCLAIFEDEQRALQATMPPLVSNAVYGDHARHRLDLYGSGQGERKPVLLFVHGGGFVSGDKGDEGAWANANVGRMAASLGMVGAVMNYRLAPEHQWPCASEDVGLALDWLRANVVSHGGDTERIVLMGTSAGAIHVAGLARLRPDLTDQVRGLILLSGLYGFTPPEDKDLRYFGDASDYPDRAPGQALLLCGVPMLLACAEYDPARFQREFLELESALLERHGAMPATYVASGHNHYTLSLHLGTRDVRLASEIAWFVEECTR